MPRSTRKAVPPQRRDDRAAMRAAGLHPMQIWVPDTRDPAFVETCRRQARAIAAHDPAGDEIMRFVAGVYEWPEP